MTISKPRSVSILGVTGSIGASTVNVLEQIGLEKFSVEAVTGMRNVSGLADNAIKLGAKIAVTADDDCYLDLKAALQGTGIEAASGREALIEAAGRPVDWTMAAIVGVAGLEPTLAAAKSGGIIALANKECLVSAGDLFLPECQKYGAEVLPVDSEHNAIHQALHAGQRKDVERMIITASGGPFRDWTVEKMADVTPEIAAGHPNWSMGQRISIDSASMFNKALEMIEAKHLFGVSPDQIEVVVHRQSIIHAMIGFCDGSIMAQLGPPDMRMAIAYALTYPARANLNVERLDFAKLSRLDFEAPDENKFPALKLARESMTTGKVSGAVLNGAKEAALDAFIAGQIGFLDMATYVENAMDALAELPAATNIDDVLAADEAARAHVKQALMSA